MLVCECTPSVSHTSHRCIDINQPVMNSGGSSDSSRKLCFLPLLILNPFVLVPLVSMFDGSAGMSVLLFFITIGI